MQDALYARRSEPASECVAKLWAFFETSGEASGAPLETPLARFPRSGELRDPEGLSADSDFFQAFKRDMAELNSQATATEEFSFLVADRIAVRDEFAHGHEVHAPSIERLTLARNALADALASDHATTGKPIVRRAPHFLTIGTLDKRNAEEFSIGAVDKGGSRFFRDSFHLLALLVRASIL